MVVGDDVNGGVIVGSIVPPEVEVDRDVVAVAVFSVLDCLEEKERLRRIVHD